jgi:hypothetical protein
LHVKNMEVGTALSGRTDRQICTNHF